MSNTGTGNTGTILRGQGVGATAKYSTATYPDTSGTSGKVLISDGTNFVSSTPTFPNASATTRKIIVSDGTNWVASTETYAVPGTSGNVLTSDGTNWTSAAPAASSKFFGTCSVTGTGGNPVDATTYYQATGSTFTTFTTSTSTWVRFYVPFACTITTVKGSIRVGGTLGSNENCTVFLRLNDTTNTNITTTLQLTAIENTFSNTGLSIACVAGDYLAFGFTGPTWATNPTTVGFAATFSS